MTEYTVFVFDEHLPRFRENQNIHFIGLTNLADLWLPTVFETPARNMPTSCDAKERR
jgi:hypothetical protein